MKHLLAAARADAAELFLTAPGGGDLVLAAQAGFAVRAFRERTRFAPGEGFPGIVAGTGRPLVCLDLAADVRFLRRLVVAKGIRRYASVPVRGRTVLGSLHVAYRRDVALDAALVGLLEATAERLGLAIELERFRAAEPLRQFRFDLSQPDAINFRLAAATALRALLAETRASQGLLLLRDGAGKLALAADSGMPTGARRTAGAGIACQDCVAVRDGVHRTFMGSGEADSPICRAAARGIPTLVCLPLVRPEAKGPPAGVVMLGYDRRLPYPSAHLSSSHELLPAADLLLNAAQALSRRAAPAPAAGASASPPAGDASFPAPGAPVPVAGMGKGFLDLRCLGRFSMSLGGAVIPAEAFLRQRSLDLLKFLLVRYPKPVHRDELLEELWPAGGNRESRVVGLNSALHYLRRVLDPQGAERASFVRRDGELISFDLESPHRLDSHEFELLAASGDRLARAGRGGQAVAAYRRASDLYAGDLLADDPACDWCQSERTYLKEIYLGSLAATGSLLFAVKDFAGAIESYRRALHADPAREAIHRDLMRALWAANQRGAALRQFEACRDDLRRVLQIDPSAETIRLRDEISASA